MLAADKQLLDAHLRNELQQLRRIEITNVVNRFQNALTPATLIAGFSFTSIVELEFTESHLSGRENLASLRAEPIFYICAAASLSLALYVTAVSSMGIVFGQRLTIQATSVQGAEHDQTVRELNNKFFWVLIALGSSMIAVVIAATAVIWVKDPSEVLGSNVGWVSIVSTVVGSVLAGLTVVSMVQMFSRLHTQTPEAANLYLRAGKGKAVAEVPEFFVAGDVPSSSSSSMPPASRRPAPAPAPDERSNLLCMDQRK